MLTRPEDAEKIYFIQRSAGAGLAPMDCFLISRGLKTLAIRMLQHNANGITVARHLDAHPKVRKTHYPGLPTHPQHDIARRQQKGPGAMIAIDLGSLEAARRFLNQLKLVLAGGEFGRSGDAGFLAGADDACFDAAGSAGADWDYGRVGEDFGGD